MAKKDELEFEGGIENAPKPNNSEKLKALQAAMDKIEKSFGKGSIMKMGDDHVQEVEVIPTGSIALNAALGVGGYPKGRIIEIYGPESSGKTTLAIHAIAEAQRAGGIAAFIDAEHAFDRFYAAKLGVDIDNLWTQLKDGEEVIGNQVRVKVVKNKVAPPFRKAEFDIMFGEGISRSGEIIDLGAELGIIKKSGSWYSYNDTKLGQGRDAAKQCIQDNPELADELEKLIFDALKDKE